MSDHGDIPRDYRELPRDVVEKRYNNLSQEKSDLVDEFNKLRKREEEISKEMRDIRRFYEVGHSYALTERAEPISERESERSDSW